MSPAARVCFSPSVLSLCATLLASTLLLCLPLAVAQGMQRGANTLTIQVAGLGRSVSTDMIHVELVRGGGLGSSRPGPFGLPFREGYCDSSGFRTFTGLPDGDYTVNVTAPGAVVSPRFIHLIGSTQEQMVYQLHPAAARGRDEGSNTVSRQWLAVPEKARKRFTGAKEDYDRHSYDRAVIELEAALAVDSGFVVAHNLLGLTWWRMQKIDLAKESFETSLRLDSKFLPTYLDYAGILTELGDFERAGQVLDQAMRMRPDSPDLHYVMARMHYASGKLEPAEQDCRRVLERDRHRIPDVHLVLSNIYLRRNRLDQVAKELETYLVRAPLGAFAKAARESLVKVKKQIAGSKVDLPSNASVPR